MFDPELYLVDELRKRLPGAGKRADHGNSRSCAIKLFCLECQGGNPEEVKNCEVFRCSLWPYRPYGPKVRPEGHVPSLAEYDAQLTDRFRLGAGVNELFGGEDESTG